MISRAILASALLLVPSVALAADGTQIPEGSHATLFALGGKLTDVVGRRSTLLAGITGFAIASVLCGATPSSALGEVWLIVSSHGLRLLRTETRGALSASRRRSNVPRIE